MDLPDVALEVDEADVVPLCPGGFPVDGTLQHPGVLAGRATDGVDADAEWMNENSYQIILREL